MPTLEVLKLLSMLSFVNNLLGRFAGQHGYGALSIFAFVDAATEIRNGTPAVDLDKDGQLATMGTTVTLTAVSSSLIVFELELIYTDIRRRKD